MKIINEKDVKMVDMECEFSNEDISKLRDYYKENASENEKKRLEINWALTDVLTKAMLKDINDNAIQIEDVKKINSCLDKVKKNK